jgi:hypothetical protein
MPVGHKKEDEENPIQKGHLETGEKKQGGHQQEEQKRPGDEPQGEQKRPGPEGEADQQKEKKTPSVHITTPASGSAFPAKGSNVPLGFECEGSGEFDAQIVVHDASGKPVQNSAHQVKLDETGKGHGQAVVGTDWLGAGKYEVHVFGSSGGEAAAIQKVQIELVDEEGKDEAVPEPAVEGDAKNPLEIKGGGV